MLTVNSKVFPVRKESQEYIKKYSIAENNYVYRKMR